HDKPEPMKVEPWLYRLAKQAIDRLAWEGSDVLATDETALQFQQPDEPAFEENVIPDPSASSSGLLADGSGITFSSNAGSSGCWNCNAVSSVASTSLPSQARRSIACFARRYSQGSTF